MVLYRKYRFQTLDQMVGQGAVKQALKSAILSNKLSHAYLFCGPRGTGKTSTARVLAKTVNCESLDKDGNPCNKCASCLSTIDGTNLDVIEMDAASNRGIEDIRNLRENIKLAPTIAKKKVYIIDEVHMLSGDAFNALLKTLEEPPSHVLFILATTELQKIPATILSRVQKLEFKKASIDELVESLQKVSEAERISISLEASRLIAQRAQGSFRDAIKLLDMFSSFGEIDEKSIAISLGTGGFEDNVDLLKNIASKNSKEALLKLFNQLDQGVNIKEVTLTIMDLLRQILLIKNGLADLVKNDLGEKYTDLEKLASNFDDQQLMLVLDNFSKSLDQLRYTSIPSLPLEVAIVSSCQEIVRGGAQERSHASTAVLSEVEGRGRTRETEATGPRTIIAAQDSEQKDEEQMDYSTSDIQKILDRWTYILETVRAYNFSLEALLRSSKIKECNQKSVVLEVPYSFHQRIIEAPKSKDLLQSILADILGRTIIVSTVLGQTPIKREELQNIEVAQDDEIIKLAAEIFNSDSVN